MRGGEGPPGSALAFLLLLQAPAEGVRRRTDRRLKHRNEGGGVKTIPVDRRRHRDRETRLLANAHGIAAAAEIGLNGHDRLALARKMMERKLEGRRTSSKLPELVEFVLARPLGRHGGGNARGNAAGCAADCSRTRAQGDDGVGGSGAGRDVALAETNNGYAAKNVSNNRLTQLVATIRGVQYKQNTCDL